VLAHSPGLARSNPQTPETPGLHDEIVDGSAELLVGISPGTLAAALGPTPLDSSLISARVDPDASLDTSYSGGFYVEPEMGFKIRKLVMIDIPAHNVKLEAILSM
jgi:hypothetical protein